MTRALSMSAAVLTLAAMAYFLTGHEPSIAVWIASGIAIVGALAGAIVPAARARTHATIAAAMMLGVSAFAFTHVIGHWPFVWKAFGDVRYAAFIATMSAVAAIGLVRGALWARWVALAFSAGCALGGTLNWIGMREFRDERAWLAALGVVGGVTIISQLLKPSVRERFAGHALWGSRHRLVRSARWAAIANFMAASMLLLYALAQPVAPATIYSALVIAPVLFVGSALVVMRRAAGVLVLGVGGLALLAHTFASTQLVAIAWDIRVVGYYAAFWVPAALLGIFAAILAVRGVAARD